MPARDASGETYLTSLGAGMVTSGVLLIAACAPAGALLAAAAGEKPIVSLLLLQSDNKISHLLSIERNALGYGEVSTIAALLAFYGVMSLLVPLVFFVIRRAGFLKVLTLSWGMFLGLSLASYWYSWANPSPLVPFGGYTFKIGYLYLVFFVIEACKALVEHKRLSALPYLYVGDGVLGIAAALIVNAGYPSSFADLLLGPIFLVAVAVSILAAEWAIVRPVTIVFIAMGRMILDKKFERRFRAVTNTGTKRLQLFGSRLVDEIASTRKLTYNARVELINSAVTNAFKELRGPSKQTHIVRLDWRIVGAIFIFNLLFPIGVGLVTWLLF